MGETKHIVEWMAMMKRHVRQRDQLLLSFFFCKHIVELIVVLAMMKRPTRFDVVGALPLIVFLLQA